MGIGQLFGRATAAIAVLALCSACTGVEPVAVSPPESPKSTSSTSINSSAGSSTTTRQASSTTAAEFVRYIHPDEWAAVRAQCLEDEGWLVEITVDGSGIRFPEVTPEQSVEMEAADERCGDRYPIDPKYRQPLSESQLEYLHTWYVEVNIPCLEAEGYSGFDPQSLDAFIEGYGSGNAWTPVDDILDQLRTEGPNALARLYEKCPAGPPVDDLYSS